MIIKSNNIILENSAIITRCIKYFNEHVFQYASKYNFNEWFVAGGAVLSTIRNGKIDIDQDADIYFRIINDLNTFKNELINRGYVITIETKSYKEFSCISEVVELKKTNTNTIDLICINKSIQEYIDEFDFTVCKCAVTTNDFYCCDSFFEDMGKYRLRIDKKLYNKNFIKRLQKYIQKGYSANEEDLVNIFMDIRNSQYNVDQQYVPLSLKNPLEKWEFGTDQMPFLKENKVEDNIPEIVL